MNGLLKSTFIAKIKSMIAMHYLEYFDKKKSLQKSKEKK